MEECLGFIGDVQGFILLFGGLSDVVVGRLDGGQDLYKVIHFWKTGGVPEDERRKGESEREQNWLKFRRLVGLFFIYF